MKLTNRILEEYENLGLLISNTHPKYPLKIYNYSRSTQYGGNWDEITLACRGLVFDTETEEIVALPFKKFFNIEEQRHVPTKDFSVFEKMDGSFGILFNYKGEWIFASRGSFTSDWARKGGDLLSKYNTEKLDPNNTYLFEIIY